MRVTCLRCEQPYDERTHWTICPHVKRPDRLIRKPTQPPLAAAGTARPASPKSVFAEDFSLLIRTPRRFRLVRSNIRVLS